ncbi:hypothetical protein BUL40_00885 [Croceivirga radicis]|uniref:Dehydrogenase n=1 Tax=Croceivirga radicis TaxID=1929488 RepID=A0A1V6LVE2_9FLAO|nr:nuclear transport factor 2 family protein [Croceivirga radicis]OQD44140.1 hypothetical protein BUL40_00885 [Croceivirga radicis]
MKKVCIVLTLFISILSFGQNEVAAITTTLNLYLEGSSYNYPEKITEAFYKDAPLFLSKPDQEIWLVSPEAYAGFYENKEKGAYNGRATKVLSIEVLNDIALAKAEIYFEKTKDIYVDIFLLKKLSGTWKIISKAASNTTRSE